VKKPKNICTFELKKLRRIVTKEEERESNILLHKSDGIK
jgi:hypothetical protein